MTGWHDVFRNSLNSFRTLGSCATGTSRASGASVVSGGAEIPSLYARHSRYLCRHQAAVA